MEATTTGRFGGRLSAVLYLLCGALLAVTVPIVPTAPDANRGAQLALAGIALASGVLIWVMPWGRWPRASTLALVPPTLVLIALFNLASGNDGFRYAPFFFITFGWLGMVHPRGTSAKVVPLAAVAYLLPLAIAHEWSAISAWSIVYVLPGCVLLGDRKSVV